MQGFVSGLLDNLWRYIEVSLEILLHSSSIATPSRLSYTDDGDHEILHRQVLGDDIKGSYTYQGDCEKLSNDSALRRVHNVEVCKVGCATEARFSEIESKFFNVRTLFHKLFQFC
jgi:hypothetical protein